MLRAPALARHFRGVFCRVLTPQPRGERGATGEARAATIFPDDLAPMASQIFRRPRPSVREALVAQQPLEPIKLNSNAVREDAVSVVLPALQVRARRVAVLLDVPLRVPAQ